MKNLANLFLFLMIGLTLNILYGLNDTVIIATLCAIILSSFLYLFPNWKYKELPIALFLLLSCAMISSFCYLPLIFYQYTKHKQPLWIPLLTLIPLLFHLETAALMLDCLVLVFLFAAYFLKIQYDDSLHLQADFRKQRDTSKELSLLLSEKNKNLLLAQEQEIHIATLNERNRIAREIHDNVGHLLSSALLQIGALQTISKEEALKEPLQNLRDTISAGMDNVRNSVHDLHDDAIDLEMALQKLMQSFTFCKCELEYMISHPLPQSMMYHLIAIVKECMNNTMKHSDATLLTLILREQPAFYQLIIRDNGTRKPVNETKGIGLTNIQERIDNLHGYLNIAYNNGYQVFITLPKNKEDEHEHRNRR